MSDVSHTTVVAHAGGLRFDAEIRGHTVRTDQPAAKGGSDTAPSPLELLSAALGGCIALYVHQFLASRGLPTEGLRVEVGTERAPGSPFRIGRFTTRLELPDGIPDELLPLIRRVVHTCPVHNTLAQAPALDLEVLNRHPVG